MMSTELEEHNAAITINKLCKDVYNIVLVTCECGAIVSHNIGEEYTKCKACDYEGNLYEFPDLFY